MALNLGFRCLNASKSLAMSSNNTARAFHATTARAVLYPNADASVFDKVTKQADRLTIAQFHADWCRPCHMLAPVLEKLTKEPNTSGSGYALDLVKIDVDSDDGQVLSQKYKVQALPTIIAFRDGTEISRFVGARDEHGSQQFLNSL